MQDLIQCLAEVLNYFILMFAQKLFEENVLDKNGLIQLRLHTILELKAMLQCFMVI